MTKKCQLCNKKKKELVGWRSYIRVCNKCVDEARDDEENDKSPPPRGVSAG